tara:strand:- start:117 stop:1172 length:1056 start_codon:yes stop_codon:yes gene_type:complete
VKICVLSYNHPPYFGGIETYSKFLYDFLDKSQFKFDFVSGKIFKYKIIRMLEVILNFYKLIIFKNKYELVHLTNLNLWPALLISKFAHNTKFVVNLHGLELVYGKRQTFTSRMYNFLIPYKLINKNKNIYFICNSNETFKLAEDKFNFDQLIFIPMGIEKIFIDENKTNINDNQFFFIGRIVERKGLSWFCENVLNHFPNTKLYFAGPIVDKDEFNKINSSKQTEYLGIIDEISKNKYISESFLTIIPNLINPKNYDFEGFGISFLEIVANNGLPIITQTQGINTSSMNGRIGVTIKNNDPELWIEKISYLQNEGSVLRTKIILESQKLIKENFIWKDIFNKTFTFYQNIL